VYHDLHTAIRERDLAVLAVHGRQEVSVPATATLLPASSYSDEEVKAQAVKLQRRVRGAWACSWGFVTSAAWFEGPCWVACQCLCWLPTGICITYIRRTSWCAAWRAGLGRAARRPGSQSVRLLCFEWDLYFEQSWFELNIRVVHIRMGCAWLHTLWDPRWAN
jgi:hypothetical protein